MLRFGVKQVELREFGLCSANIQGAKNRLEIEKETKLFDDLDVRILRIKTDKTMETE